MRVECVTSSYAELPAEVRERIGPLDDGDWRLDPGASFVVYAMQQRENGLWFAICDGGSPHVPRWLPAELFAVLDRRPSRYWRLQATLRGAVVRTLFAVEPWADDELFYSDLIGGDARALEVFRDFRRLMDREYPDSSIPLGAEPIQDPWVACPACRHEFQTHPENAMAPCPNCRAPLHNPWHD